VVIGHGSVELLWSLVQVLATDAPGRPLLMVTPTFSEPMAAARANRIEVVSVAMAEHAGFALDALRIGEAIIRHAPFAVYLCQPNNPTGRALPHAVLADLVARHPRVTFIVDEAFLSLSTRHGDALLPLPANAVRVRSLTKDHGLAGLRVGYAVCTPERAERLEARRPPWLVSAPAQAAIRAAMGQLPHAQSVRTELLRCKGELVAELSALGIEALASETTFFLARVPRQLSDADALRARLLQEHAVLVRSGSSFGLPQYIRLPACLPPARARLMTALCAAMERA
jgi:histidinol-phosphate aminotransferase